MGMPSHKACLELLTNPSTQNILETFGYEYSAGGQSEFRTAKPDIVAVLIHAIVAELALDPIFPPSARKTLPDCGMYVHRRDGGFAVIDIDKPSVVDEFMHTTEEGAARSYIYKRIDPYWLQFDSSRIPSR